MCTVYHELCAMFYETSKRKPLSLSLPPASVPTVAFGLLMAGAPSERRRWTRWGIGGTKVEGKLVGALFVVMCVDIFYATAGLSASELKVACLRSALLGAAGRSRTFAIRVDVGEVMQRNAP